jgi:hypothetical protein
MSDIVERLRKHVNNRGGPSLQNGAWEMMLEAADEIEKLRDGLRIAARVLAAEAAEAKLMAGGMVVWTDDGPVADKMEVRL